MTGLVVLLVFMVLGLLVVVAKLWLDLVQLGWRVDDLESDVCLHTKFGTSNDGKSMHALMDFVMRRQDALVANNNARLDSLVLSATSDVDDYGVN